MTVKLFIQRFDWILFGIALVIASLSFAVFYNLDDRAGQFIARQAVIVPIGIAVMFAASFFDYRIFKNRSSPAITVYVIALALLGLALASREIRGVSSWIILSKFTFQPAEFAKLAMLVILAKYFSARHIDVNSMRHVLASGVYAALPLAMVFIQPDFGSAFVLASIWLLFLIFAGINKKNLAGIFILAVVAFSVLWLVFFEDYQRNRVLAFLDPYADPRGQGYHLIQSQTAIGSGGIWGSIWNSGFDYSVPVPEPYTDFAFTFFAHKFGFVGVVGLTLLFCWFLVRLVRISSREAKNNFGRFFIMNFGGIIVIHFAVNAGMNLGLLPITGIPLPFLSYGGSHFITLMAGLGLVQSIKIRG